MHPCLEQKNTKHIGKKILTDSDDASCLHYINKSIDLQKRKKINILLCTLHTFNCGQSLGGAQYHPQLKGRRQRAAARGAGGISGPFDTPSPFAGLSTQP